MLYITHVCRQVLDLDGASMPLDYMHHEHIWHKVIPTVHTHHYKRSGALIRGCSVASPDGDHHKQVVEEDDTLVPVGSSHRHSWPK